MRNPLSLRNKHGRLIRDLREKQGLTQSQLAGLLELGRSSVSDLESGDRDLGLYELVILCRTFDVTVDDFLTAEKDA